MKRYLFLFSLFLGFMSYVQADPNPRFLPAHDLYISSYVNTETSINQVWISTRAGGTWLRDIKVLDRGSNSYLDVYDSQRSTMTADGAVYLFTIKTSTPDAFENSSPFNIYCSSGITIYNRTVVGGQTRVSKNLIIYKEIE